MVSLRKLRGLLTEEDKQKFLENLLNEHKKSKEQRLMEEIFKDIVIECPYCHEEHLFGPVDEENSFRRELVFKLKNKTIVKDMRIDQCPKTKRYIFTYADIVVEGDILTGEHYRYDIHTITDEQIRQALDYKAVKLDDTLKKLLGIKERAFPFSSLFEKK